MSCSSLSILSKIAMVISGFTTNGTIFKNNVGAIGAIQLATTNPNTGATMYSVLSHPLYSNCFERSTPLMFEDLRTKWVPSVPLQQWPKEDLADELVECKNSFRVLKRKHVVQSRKLYTTKKMLLDRINAKKVLRTTPAPEKKIPVRPTQKLTVAVAKAYVAPPKTVIYKEPEKRLDPLRHNLVVPITRSSPITFSRPRRYRSRHRHRRSRHRRRHRRRHRHRHYRHSILRPIKKSLRKVHRKIKG